MLSSTEVAQFRVELLAWYERHRRDLPWRRTRDPYFVWISEIMLQQTRVRAVIPYYERFLARFPNFRALAEAAEAELLACWSGLGYYHRARNLQKAARQMKASGGFPSTYEEIRSLPGIGDYTAAAIASIGFHLPHAVLDGNVLRVLSRILADATDISTVQGRKHFADIVQHLLDKDQPGTFNQAIMELGATVCLPKNPQCLLCPVSNLCKARASARQNDFPVKNILRANVHETRIVYWIERGSELLAWQRPSASRLMAGFWELPERAQLPNAKPSDLLGTFRHSITFHNYVFELRHADVPADLGECRWLSLESLEALPISTILKKARRLKKARLGS